MIQPRMSMRAKTRAVIGVIAVLGGGVEAQTLLPKAVRQSDVIYGRRSGLALTMEVLTPVNSNGLGVLWVVSSGGRSSREQTLTGSFEQRIAPLLNRGYSVFAVIHGSAPVFNVQDMAQDVRRAVRFVRERAVAFKIDGQRLGIAGSSSGGLLALLVALQGDDGDPTSSDIVERASSRLQAAGCFFSPTDLTNYGAPAQSVIDVMQKQAGSIDPSFQFYALDAKTGARLPLTTKEDVARMLGEMSPVTHATGDDPPTLLIHGDQDRNVPIQQSRELAERLRQARVPVEFVLREGVGHAYPGWEADTALIVEWFDKHLRR
jgi:acetyl esterase/lipase